MCKDFLKVDLVLKSVANYSFSCPNFKDNSQLINSRARNYSKLPDNLQYLSGIAATEQVNMHQ